MIKVFLLSRLTVARLLLPPFLLMLVACLQGRIAETAKCLIHDKRLIWVSVKPSRPCDMSCKVSLTNSGTDIRLEVGIKMSPTGTVQFAGKRCQINRLVGRRPVDADAGALCEFGMYHHDCAPVAVEERVPIREVAHYLAGLARHEVFVMAQPQGVLN